MATTPPVLQSPRDSYVPIDKVPDYEKTNVRISIESDSELSACIKLEKEGKCYMFIGDTRISIDEHEGARTAIFSVKNRQVVSKTYQIYKVGSDGKMTPDKVGPNTPELKIIRGNGITRTPLFSKLPPIDGLNSDKSIYLSGIKSGKKDDAIAIKEQSNVFNDEYLRELRKYYQEKRGEKPRPVYLYAKNVKTQKYEKVSFPKTTADTEPVSVIYLNPLSGKRADAEKDVLAKLDKDIADKAAEIANMTTELALYRQVDSKPKKTCSTFSKVLEDDLVKNAEAELNQLLDAKAKLDADKADPKYLSRTVQFGEEKTIADFKKDYILIMSYNDWTSTTAPPDATDQNNMNLQQARDPTATSSFNPFGLFTGSKGGRRKTKKSNKKSRKGKSKKQNKSRKGFFY